MDVIVQAAFLHKFKLVFLCKAMYRLAGEVINSLYPQHKIVIDQYVFSFVIDNAQTVSPHLLVGFISKMLFSFPCFEGVSS